jgi:hypothetical protein
VFKHKQYETLISKLDAQQLLFLSVRSLLYRIIYKLEKKDKIMSQFDDTIATLTGAVTAETSEVASAEVLINSIPTLISTAVAAAIAAGATPVQLQALTDLSTSLTKNTGELTTAVVANTPSAPAPTPVPVPTPDPGPTGP